jgi:hypothetical protein
LCCFAIRKPFDNAKRGDASRVSHQVLDLTSTPHCVQTPLFCVLRLNTATPQRVIKSVALENDRIGQRLVVGFRFT